MTVANPLEPADTRTWKESLDELCVALNLSEGDLFDLLNHLPRYYYVKPFVSRSGKPRTFYVAHGRLLAIHKQLVAWLSRLPLHNAAHGWRKGCSPLTAVAPHIGKPCVISLDIENFYPTVSPRRVRNLYMRLGCVPEIADILTRLTTYKGHLAQGLKTSPAIANLVMYDIDERIDIACRNLGFAYTRYGDDITMSGGRGTRHIESLVKSILRQTGFEIKQEKTERSQQHNRQTSLKLVVNKQSNLPREQRQRLRAVAHNCLTKGLASEQQIGEDSSQTESRIRGELSYWAQANSSSARSSQQKFEQSVKNYKQAVKADNITTHIEAEEV